MHHTNVWRKLQPSEKKVFKKRGGLTLRLGSRAHKWTSQSDL